MKYWISAARPKTLVAGAIPVMLGSALAFQRGGFRFGVFLTAFLSCLAIQVGTNYVNDAADFEKGADTQDRLGPPRMALSGFLSPRSLYLGAAISFFIAFLLGSYLISVAGLPILIIGIFSILFAIGYTAGPFPLAYLGLGDLFVLVFFGLIAVLGTVYAHMQAIPEVAFWLSLATGLHGVGLIAVNNLRDIPTDIKAGKKTIAVRIGDHNSRVYYTALLFLPYLCWLPIALNLQSFWSALPFLSLPLAFANAKECFRIEDRKEFNTLLAKTAALQLLFGILASLALVVS